MICPNCNREMAKDGTHSYWKKKGTSRVLVKKQRWLCRGCGLNTIKTGTYECLRCGHKWQAKDGTRPLRCAKCKSPYWDRPVNKVEDPTTIVVEPKQSFPPDMPVIPICDERTFPRTKSDEM